MIKDKSRLAIKLFIIVWIVLAVHITLKLTFNYWQPYVVSSARLQAISDYIDTHRWLQATLNGIFYFINGLLVMLCSIKRWWFKSKKQSIIVMITILLAYIYSIVFGQSSLVTLILSFLIPLIIDYKKWLYVILTFVFSNVFMLLSFWLEGFANSNNMPYIIGTFLNIDYYIMLVLNYFVFNMIKEKGKENNG